MNTFFLNSNLWLLGCILFDLILVCILPRQLNNAVGFKLLSLALHVAFAPLVGLQM